MLYEFLFGSCPFGEDEDDAYSIYKKVLERNINYPRKLSENVKAVPLIE